MDPSHEQLKHELAYNQGKADGYHAGLDPSIHKYNALSNKTITT